MEITWLGHAALRVRGASATLIADPYPTDSGLRMPPAQAQADVVTLSSDDPLHAAAGEVAGTNLVIDGPGEYEASGLRIWGVRTTRRTPDGAPQAWNTMYTAEIDGVSLCHLGNPDRLLTKRELDELGSPHVLALPVGSADGISAADAVEIARALDPKVIVPVLYAHPGNRAPLRALAAFLTELGAASPDASPRLAVTRSTLPDEQTLAVLAPSGALL